MVTSNIECVMPLSMMHVLGWSKDGNEESCITKWVSGFIGWSTRSWKISGDSKHVPCVTLEPFWFCFPLRELPGEF